MLLLGRSFDAATARIDAEECAWWESLERKSWLMTQEEALVASAEIMRLRALRNLLAGVVDVTPGQGPILVPAREAARLRELLRELLGDGPQAVSPGGGQ